MGNFSAASTVPVTSMGATPLIPTSLSYIKNSIGMPPGNFTTTNVCRPLFFHRHLG